MSKDAPVAFVCFGNGSFVAARDRLASDAAASGLFSRVVTWGAEEIQSTDEYKGLSERLLKGKGFGCYWWKPYIIRKTLEGLPEGGAVFYSDSGRYGGGFSIDKSAEILIRKYRDTGFCGVEIPQFGPARLYTKLACFKVMGCATEAIMEAPQIQATFSMWVNTPASRKLLSEWELWSRNEESVCDPLVGEENSPDFRVHRHDQAVLTNVVRKHGGVYIDITSAWEKPLLRAMSKSYEVNVSYKTIGFVSAVVGGKSKWPLMWSMRRQRKSAAKA